MKKLIVLLFFVLTTATIRSDYKSKRDAKAFHRSMIVAELIPAEPAQREQVSAILAKQKENKEIEKRIDISPLEKIQLQLANLRSIKDVTDKILEKYDISNALKEQLEAESFFTIAVETGYLYACEESTGIRRTQAEMDQLNAVHATFIEQYVIELSKRYPERLKLQKLAQDISKQRGYLE